MVCGSMLMNTHHRFRLALREAHPRVGRAGWKGHVEVLLFFVVRRRGKWYVVTGLTKPKSSISSSSSSSGGDRSSNATSHRPCPKFYVH